MTIQTHNVTATMVLGHLPANTAGVTATSKGLNTGTVDGWIEMAAGEVNGILVRNGINPGTLDENATALVQAAIVANVGVSCLERLNADSETLGRWWEKWRSIRKTLRENPGDLGKAQDDAKPAVTSNVDTTSPTPSKWRGDEWNGF